MCLILFALNEHSKYKLVLAANRDEFFDRPTLVADFWKENDTILGGKDEQSGGTWIGLTKNGRFIAITNFRDPKNEKENPKSRGDISKNFLSTNKSVTEFLSKISKNKNQYNGFNLILSDDNLSTLYHYSNITDLTTSIDDGIHGLSNHLLDTPWPKIQIGKSQLNDLVKDRQLKINELAGILRNTKKAPDNSLPETGISFDLEKKLSPVFISMKRYGTRCSTIILVDKTNKVSFLEITYNERAQAISEKTYEFQLKP